MPLHCAYQTLAYELCPQIRKLIFDNFFRPWSFDISLWIFPDNCFAYVLVFCSYRVVTAQQWTQYFNFQDSDESLATDVRSEEDNLNLFTSMYHLTAFDNTHAPSDPGDPTVAANIPPGARNNNYPCLYCCKTFSFASKLRDHMRTHTGERPFQCHLCAYRASRVWVLKRHMHSVHSVQVNFSDCPNNGADNYSHRHNDTTGHAHEYANVDSRWHPKNMHLC